MANNKKKKKKKKQVKGVIKPKQVIKSKKVINYQYASFWIRLLAFFIDGLIASIIGYIIGFLCAGVVCLLALVIGGVLAQDIIMDLIMIIIGFMMVCLYFALMENSKMQATLGKKIVGIKVIDQDGERITFDSAIIRFFTKILSGLILGIGYLMIFRNPKKQGLHDKITKTYVIKNV
jgi:uncharacterized RDD family membrane protein YckC